MTAPVWILEDSGAPLSIEEWALCAPVPDTLHHERQIERAIMRLDGTLRLEWLLTSHTVLLAFPRLEPIASTPWDRVLLHVGDAWCIAVRAWYMAPEQEASDG